MIFFLKRLLLLVVIASLSLSNQLLKTFYLNKKASLTSRPISQYNGRECIHTMDKVFSLPRKSTICYRHQPMVFNYRSGLISIGKIDERWGNLKIGIVYGNYDSGGWLGIVEGLKPINWIPMGLHRFTTQVWRHTCITLDFSSGIIQLFENGEKMHEEALKNYHNVFEKLQEDMTLVTVGCAYIENLDEDWTYAMSMLGRFTDFQLFGRVLQNKEMEEITGCQKIVQDDDQ